MCYSLNEFVRTCPLKYFSFNDVKLGKKLGEGGNAVVYKGYFRGKEHAVKVYDSNKWCERNNVGLDDLFDSLTYEFKVAKLLESSLLSMKTYGYTYIVKDTGISFMVMMELLVSDGSLYEYLSGKAWWTACRMNDNGWILPMPKTNYVYHNEDEGIHWCYGMPMKHKLRITCGILKAVKELHENGVIHADIKTDNIILHYGVTNQVIKLIDFGMSNMETDIDMSCVCGTMGYCAPEQYNYQLSTKSDIYSTAVTIIEVWNGDIWYDEGADFDACRREVLNGLVTIKKGHPTFAVLLKRCLSLDDEQRPTAKELLSQFYKLKFN
jgi:serine/threonine protein kinase